MRGVYGENLEFLHIPNGGIKEAVAGWMAGGRLYNFRNPGYTTGSSFFTQVVWKATTQVGCAAVTCPPFTIYPGNPATNIVCYYNPRGNVPGQFAQNVGPHV
ncbi:hypothetical protein BX616_006262 [Lobosporangium transversale]|nr:hypothetical protein BX616_006262 [Lobosporangium transversale]